MRTIAALDLDLWEFAVKYRRPVLAVTLLTVALGLEACSGTTSTTSSSATPSTASRSATQTSGPASTSPSPTQPTKSTKASGRCSSIDQKTAETILGFATAAGRSSTAGSTSSMKKIDGCMYKSATDGGLGYDVVQVNAQVGRMSVGAIKARMAQAGGTVTTFDVGLPNSVSFTMHDPLGVDSQVTVVSGDRLITIASTRKDGNVAKAQASATAAAKLLVSST